MLPSTNYRYESNRIPITNQATAWHLKAKSYRQLPVLPKSVLKLGTIRAMATNVTLINNSLVKEYLTYDGQDVIVDSTLTDAGECSIIIILLC